MVVPFVIVSIMIMAVTVFMTITYMIFKSDVGHAAYRTIAGLIAATTFTVHRANIS
jgi:hypothetical protein